MSLLVPQYFAVVSSGCDKFGKSALDQWLVATTCQTGAAAPAVVDPQKEVQFQGWPGEAAVGSNMQMSYYSLLQWTVTPQT